MALNSPTQAIYSSTSRSQVLRPGGLFGLDIIITGLRNRQFRPRHHQSNAVRRLRVLTGIIKKYDALDAIL